MVKKRKVGLICNMNNNLFSLSKYLMDRGYETTLYVLPFESPHFLPKADSQDLNKLGSIIYLEWGNPYELGNVSVEQIRREFGRHDFIIGCGPSPAYLSKAGIKLDIFSPYGTDLIHYPFLNLMRPIKMAKYILSMFTRRKELQTLPSRPANMKGYLPFVYYQRKGIRESTACLVPTSGKDVYGQALKRLKFSNSHFSLGLPMIYVPQYTGSAINASYSTSRLYNKFLSIRENYDFLIFHNCRHAWVSGDPVEHKGNNRLFEGFEQFSKSYKGKAAIITFEYGIDVLASKNLIKSLGIEKYVYWFPITERKELMAGISIADLVVGNLSDASWLIYGVVYEAMTLKKPIMHHRNDLHYPASMLYPMINAFDVETVRRALARYAYSKHELEEIGKEAHEWFLTSCIEKPIETIIGLIENK
jgi:hypothetical protein